MKNSHTLKKNLYVRANFFTREELLRQRRLGLSEVDEQVLEGLVAQKAILEDQQRNMIRGLVFSLLFTYVAWSGGDIKVPGTGASMTDIPAFLELSLIVSSLSIMMISYTFLSIHLYNAVIGAVAEKVVAHDELDPDIFIAAKTPLWMFLKYASQTPIPGRKPGFLLLTPGRLFYGALTTFISFALLALWFLAISSVLVISHIGLSSDVLGWGVYSTCIFMLFTSFLAMAAVVLEFNHEMDFSALEED